MNNSSHLLSTYYGLGSCTHMALVLTEILQGGYSHSHFIDDKRKAPSSEVNAISTQWMWS